jgi:RNA polymerase sigma-70 factor (ECF subfamily)
MTHDDHALVQAAAGGDRQALDTLLRRHYDRIFAVCRRITGNDADAADAAQDALISIVRSIGRFDGRASFSTWAYRIATNASLDELRRRRRRPTVIDDRNDRRSEGTEAQIVDPEAAPRIEAIADRMAIDAALAQLPETFRVPLVLRDVGDLEYAEIAETLDVPVGTVKSRIARGRAQLIELLDAGNQAGPSDRQTPAP